MVTTTDLHIAPGLDLDPDYVGGGTFALLAKKGAGKTYTGRVMAEEMWKAKVPFVVLDPMGAWWGLRAGADGKGDGIPVAIFGGEHGDAPLERGSGELMADLVVDERLSMILDLRGFGTRAAEREFARTFLERLYRRNRELVHVFLDEADLFAPQKPQSGDQHLLGVTENIVRRGRNNGIGITLITQRPAVLNKDVLTQVDGLVAMRIIGLTDREAIDKWVEGHGDQEAASKVKGTLSGLANGECWWWVPELGVLQRVQVRKAKTFDSSPTRKRGEARREPKTFADVDMAAIEERMAETIERAKATDPERLQRRIRELEEAAGARSNGTPPPDPRIESLQRELDTERRKVADTQRALAARDRELAEAQAQRDAASRETETVAALRRSLAALLGDLPVATGGGDYPGDEHVRGLIRAHAPAGGAAATLMPVEALRADYLERTAQRLVERIRDLSADEREALLFLLAQGKFVTINATSKALSGHDGGGQRNRWSAAYKSLMSAGLVIQGGDGRTGRKENIEAWVRTELGPHSPTDAEIAAVRDRALSVLQGGVA